MNFLLINFSGIVSGLIKGIYNLKIKRLTVDTYIEFFVNNQDQDSSMYLDYCRLSIELVIRLMGNNDTSGDYNSL